MRLILVVLIALMASPAYSQIELGRQVIGSTSLNGSLSVGSLHSTLGETAVQRFNAENIVFTQGFEQPGIQPFLVEIETGYSDCWNGQNAVLNFITLSGCGEEYEFELLNAEGSAEALDALSAGMYSLTVTAAGGCVYQTDFTVLEPDITPCDLQIYNVVTPNGDGFNDSWIIEGIEAEKYDGNTVQVYNRWGQQVWSTRNYTNGVNAFDGNDLDGVALPEGAYLFEITWEPGNSLTGTINLLQ